MPELILFLVFGLPIIAVILILIMNNTGSPAFEGVLVSGLPNCGTCQIRVTLTENEIKIDTYEGVVSRKVKYHFTLSLDKVNKVDIMTNLLGSYSVSTNNSYASNKDNGGLVHDTLIIDYSNQDITNQIIIELPALHGSANRFIKRIHKKKPSTVNSNVVEL